MQYMCKAVWIKQVLRSMRTPNITIPQERPETGAPPDSALIAQLSYRGYQWQSKCEPWPRLTCRKIFHKQKFSKPDRESSIGNRQLFPAGLSEEMFEENGAGDGIVEGVVGFAARADFADAGFKFEPGN